MGVVWAESVTISVIISKKKRMGGRHYTEGANETNVNSFRDLYVFSRWLVISTKS